jgi:hypothetical protein
MLDDTSTTNMMFDGTYDGTIENPPQSSSSDVSEPSVPSKLSVLDPPALCVALVVSLALPPSLVLAARPPHAASTTTITNDSETRIRHPASHEGTPGV